MSAVKLTSFLKLSTLNLDHAFVGLQVENSADSPINIENITAIAPHLQLSHQFQAVTIPAGQSRFEYLQVQGINAVTDFLSEKWTSAAIEAYVTNNKSKLPELDLPSAVQKASPFMVKTKQSVRDLQLAALYPSLSAKVISRLFPLH